MNAVPSLRFLPLSDGKQPLYMWSVMFLVNRFEDPLFISRAMSVFCGMLTLIGIFLLSYTLYKSRLISFLSSFFWAVSPYSVFFDRMAMADSMLAMFGVWALFFTVLAVRFHRFDFAMLAGFALGGALLTKSPAVYFVILLPLVLILSPWPERKEKEKAGMREFIHLIKKLPIYIPIYLISFFMYNILRLGENFHMISSRNMDYVYPISHLWISPFNPLKINLTNTFDFFWILGPSVLVTFFLFSVIYNSKIDFVKMKKKVNPATALLFLWIAVPVLLTCLYAKTLTARYLLFVFPAFCIFSSLVFENLHSKNKLLGKVLIFGLLIYSYQAIYSNTRLLSHPEKMPLPRIERSGYLEEWTAGTGIKEVSLFLRSEYLKDPDLEMVVGTEGYFGTLPDGLQVYLNDLPGIVVIGTGLDFNQIPESLIESKKAGNRTYFVVNSTRLNTDYHDLNLKLLNSFEKARKPDGTKELLYFFEVM